MTYDLIYISDSNKFDFEMCLPQEGSTYRIQVKRKQKQILSSDVN